METERRSSRAGRPLGTLFRVCSAAWLLLQLSTPSRAFSTPPVYKALSTRVKRDAFLGQAVQRRLEGLHGAVDRALRPGGRTSPLYSDNGDDRWASSNVDDFVQRIESLKAAVVAGVSGSTASVVPGLLFDVLLSPAYGVTGSGVAQWEFDTDMLALECALLGVVYRYAVREDRNPDLKDGVVGAFALTRALSLVKTSSTCMSVPLRCGPPIEYMDWPMLTTLGAGLVTSFVAFGVAARAIEWCFEKGWIQKFPGK